MQAEVYAGPQTAAANRVGISFLVAILLDVRLGHWNRNQSLTQYAHNPKSLKHLKWVETAANRNWGHSTCLGTVATKQYPSDSAHSNECDGEIWIWWSTDQSIIWGRICLDELLKPNDGASQCVMSHLSDSGDILLASPQTGAALRTDYWSYE